MELAVRYGIEAHQRQPDDFHILEVFCLALKERYITTKNHKNLDEAIARVKQALAQTDIPPQAKPRLTALAEELDGLNGPRVRSKSSRVADQEIDKHLREFEET